VIFVKQEINAKFFSSFCALQPFIGAFLAVVKDILHFGTHWCGAAISMEESTKFRELLH
jgi:hypothetical protein